MHSCFLLFAGMTCICQARPELDQGNVHAIGRAVTNAFMPTGMLPRSFEPADFKQSLPVSPVGRVPASTDGRVVARIPVLNEQLLPSLRGTITSNIKVTQADSNDSKYWNLKPISGCLGLGIGILSLLVYAIKKMISVQNSFAHSIPMQHSSHPSSAEPQRSVVEVPAVVSSSSALGEDNASFSAVFSALVTQSGKRCPDPVNFNGDACTITLPKPTDDDRMHRIPESTPQWLGYINEDDPYRWKSEKIDAVRKSIGGNHEIDVDILNTLFREEGAGPMQRRIHPTAPYAAIFRLETLVDLSSVHIKAWRNVATRFGWRPPTNDEVRRTLTMLPEFAIMREFYTFDRQFLDDASKVFVEEFREELNLTLVKIEQGWYGSSAPISKADPDTSRWFETICDLPCPVAVLSPFPDSITRRVLKLAALDHLNPILLTQDDGYVRYQQALLGAVLKLKRPPLRTLFFGLSPTDAVVAHSAGMRVVCLSGAYSAHEMGLADRNIKSFAEMNQWNLKNMFSDIEFDSDSAPELQPEMEPELQELQAPVTTMSRWEPR